MKLKSKAPKEGDIKCEAGMAFLPTAIDEDTTVWLEGYTRWMIYKKPWASSGLAGNPIWMLYDRNTKRYLDPGCGSIGQLWRDENAKIPSPPPNSNISGVNK